MAPDDTPQIDAGALRDAATGCGWTLDELVRFYEPRARAELDKIREALETGSAATLARLAHGAAGSSATLGCTSLANLYRELSDAASATDTVDLAARTDRLARHLESTLQLLDSLARGES
jgi:HPt (histidine-containing phosphotransfer) domain-containing protein